MSFLKYKNKLWHVLKSRLIYKLSEILYWYFGQGGEISKLAAVYIICEIPQNIDNCVRYRIFKLIFEKFLTLWMILLKERKALFYDKN